MPLVDNINDYIDLLPSILYKFRSWKDKNHRNVLFNQEVYFSPVDNFIDESDCKFPVKFPSSHAELSEWLDCGADILLNRYPFKNDRDKKKLIRINYLQGSLGQQELKNNFYSRTNAVLGVLSLTGRTDNTKMWESDYANNFEGFCFGFNPKKCEKEFRENQIFGSECKYVSESEPAIPYVSTYLKPENATDFFVEVIRRKYKQFEFEEEYRLVKLFPQEDYSKGIKSQDRLFQIPKHAYQEIVVGYKMPDCDVQEIIRVCQDQKISVPIRVASPDGRGGISYITIT